MVDKTTHVFQFFNYFFIMFFFCCTIKFVYKTVKTLTVTVSLKKNLSSTSSIYSSKMILFSSFLVSVVVFLFFAFLSSSFDDISALSAKIVSDKSLNKFNNSFCLGVCFFVLLFLRFLVRLMYLNLF